VVNAAGVEDPAVAALITGYGAALVDITASTGYVAAAPGRWTSPSSSAPGSGTARPRSPGPTGCLIREQIGGYLRTGVDSHE